LPRLQEAFAPLGPIQSMSFVEVDFQGSDVYDVNFASSSLKVMIALTPDGKTAGMGILPPGPPPGAAPR